LPEAGWAAIVPLLAGWFASGAAGVIACAIGLVVAVTFSGYCLRRIGGATGDTLGATSELVEVAVALALIATPVRLLWNM
jgi:cobalamin synthase